MPESIKNSNKIKNPNKRSVLRFRSQRGQGLVELALILPVLLLVIWGLIEFARIFQAYVTVQHAAREGARYAVTGQHILLSDDDDIPGNFSPGEQWENRPSSIITITHKAALGLARVRPDADVSAREPRSDLAYYYDVVLDPPDGGIPYGAGITDTITVTVHYNVPLLIPVIGDLLGSIVPVTGQVVMENEAFEPTPGAYVYTLLDGSGYGGTGGDGGGGGGGDGGVATDTPTPIPVDCSSSHFQANSPGSDSIETFTLSNFSGIDDGDELTVVVGDGTHSWEYKINFKVIDQYNNIDQVQITYDGNTVYDSGAGLELDLDLDLYLANTVDLLDISSVVTGTTIAYDYGDYPTVEVSSNNTLAVTFTSDTGTTGSVCLTITAAPPTPTPTVTLTPIPTSTPTPTSTPMPIALDEPLADGDTLVTGTGEPGLVVTLRDFSQSGAPTIGTGVIQIDGTFSINVSALVAGHIIVASAGNSADFATVSGGPTPTATATSTPTFTPTATPTSTPVSCTTLTDPGGNDKYTYTQNNISGSDSIGVFTLGQFTGVDDKDELKIKVKSWDASKSKYDKPQWEYKIKFKNYSGTVKIEKIEIKYDDGTKSNYTYNGPLDIPLLPNDAPLNLLNPVTGDTTPDSNSNDYDYNDVAVSGNNELTVEFPKDKKIGSVCLAVPSASAPTPTATPTSTPTPTGPDLIVATMNITYSGIITVNQPFTVEVVAKNQGTNSVNSLSWVNLYADPVPAPPGVGQLGDAWSGIDSLAAGSQITLTFIHPGFATGGDHLLYAQVDTWGQIVEANEANNVYGPITITVGSSGGPTPTPTATPANPGAVSGAAWLFFGGDLLPIGYARIECRSGSTVVATTVADASGNYNFGMVIPPGTYDIYGEATLNGVIYSDISTGIQVIANTETPYVTLVLH